LVGPVELVTSVEHADRCVVVSVQGDVDLVSSPELRRVLDEALRLSPRVQVDLSGLTFVDSSGLSAFVQAHRKARDAGGVLELHHPTPMLRRLLDITQLSSLLVVEPPDQAATADEA
jgi:anti-sigma B factor antagonist